MFNVCDALKEYNESICRIQNVVRYVRSSPVRVMKFKKCIENEKICCNCVVCLNVPTRWNSTYLMLEVAIKFKKSFDRLDDNDESYKNESPPTKHD